MAAPRDHPGPTRLAVLVSGGGRTLENLAAVIRAGELPATIELAVSDRPNAFGLERARRLGIPTRVVPYDPAAGPEAFRDRVLAEVEARAVDLIVLAGFLRLLLLPERWLGRVVNIHPSLLPAFGGRGFYGDRVHRAVLAAGVPETGCTVHLVDNEYDRGRILLQRRVPVLADDTVETLAARVFEEEKRALPDALRQLVAG